MWWRKWSLWVPNCGMFMLIHVLEQHAAVKVVQTVVLTKRSCHVLATNSVCLGRRVSLAIDRDPQLLANGDGTQQSAARDLQLAPLKAM